MRIDGRLSPIAIALIVIIAAAAMVALRHLGTAVSGDGTVVAAPHDAGTGKGAVRR